MDQEKIKLWVSGISIICVGVIGCIGNIFTLYIVCTNHLKKHLFYQLIFCLACFDTITIFSFGIEKLLEVFAECVLTKFHEYLCAVFKTFGLIGSIYMTVAISLERYLGICHENSRFGRRLLIYIIPVLLLTSALCVPDVVDLFQFFENGTVILDKEFADLEGEDWIFFEALGIRMIIPTILIVVLNGAIFLRIREARLLLNIKMPEHQQRRSQTVRILFLIVFVFILCSVIPRLAFRIMFKYAKDMKEWMKPFTNLLIIVNSSVNIFIYCYVGTDFRRNSIETIKRSISTTTFNLSSTDSNKN